VRCDNPKGNGGEKTVDKIVVPAIGIYLRCPEEAEEAGLVSRKSEKRFTDWPESVRRWRRWKSGDGARGAILCIGGL
jgi:hypothetical protein